MEVLKQKQYQPMSVGAQVAVIYAASKGFLDKVEVSEVNKWQEGFSAFLTSNFSTAIDKIENRAKLKDVEEDLKSALEQYNQSRLN
jgi:F0F1-type ATP synthase alpha subunit